MRQVRDTGAPQGRSHRHRHALGVRPPDALRSWRRAFRSSRPRRSTCARSSTSCCGSCAARPTSPSCASTASPSGTSGRTSNGELGPVYGKQWRAWPAPDGRSIDQISQVVEQLRSNPDSRRIIVSAWNVGELEQMALHALPRVLPVLRRRRRRLSCQLYQRSADIFLGVPFNIASYALLDAHARAAVRPRSRASSSGRAATATCI